MSATANIPRSSTLRILAAFGAIYFIWGSTYLFIRWGVETIPPFILAGARHVFAGTVMLVLVLRQGWVKTTAQQWLSCAIVGTLLLVGGNGGVTWAEQRIASGLASLLVATMPLWLVLLDWLRPGGVAPRAGAALGLLLGFGGVALLVWPSKLGANGVDMLGAAVVVLAALSWATGSLYSRRGHLPGSLFQAATMQSFSGGAVLWLLATFTGEWGQLDPVRVSVKSLLSLAYLVIFGSALGFTAYIWLLRVTTPTRVSTYAYVNPVVAVLLGWAFAGEPVSGRMLSATALIVVAVALVIMNQHRPSPSEPMKEVVPANAAECAD